MNINAMMQQAKKMQAEMAVKEQALATKKFTIEKQGITMTFRGNRQLEEIKINEALVDPEDPETLEDMLIVTFNEALKIIDKEHMALAPQQTTGMPF